MLYLLPLQLHIFQDLTFASGRHTNLCLVKRINHYPPLTCLETLDSMFFQQCWACTPELLQSFLLLHNISLSGHKKPFNCYPCPNSFFHQYNTTDISHYLALFVISSASFINFSFFTNCARSLALCLANHMHITIQTDIHLYTVTECGHMKGGSGSCKS